MKSRSGDMLRCKIQIRSPATKSTMVREWQGNKKDKSPASENADQP